jgi:RNA polymerase sigma-70 factor (ECF subfamily)
MFGWRSGNETLTRSQDSELFLALLEPVRDSLHRFAVRNVWRRDQVTDVLQEAVMTGWRHFGKFERGTNFRAWMFKILLNTLYRINRKSHRTREVRFEADMFDAGAFDAGQVMDRETAWASILDDPERVMEALDERVVQALDTLAPTERQCFLLRLLEDFSYKEIAEQLDLPLGTVMSHVYRARMKLRERLAALALEEGIVKSPGGDGPP